MMLLEFDLSGAEWVVVAYLSGDSNMIGVIESGKSPHVITGALITGATEEFVLEDHKRVGNHTDQDTISKLREGLVNPTGLSFLPRSMSIRQAGKKSNHGLNYGMKYRRAALEWEITEGEAAPIVTAYSTTAYPGLQLWWSATRAQLKKDRTLTNCFGRKVRLLGEWGNDLFDQAYSFIPQSTVVDVCLKAMVLAYEDETPLFKNAQLSAQVHDSLMVQVPIPKDRDGWISLAKMCYKLGMEYMRPYMSYSGREFRLGVDLKLGMNWGNMVGMRLGPDLSALAIDLQREVAVLQEAALVQVDEELPVAAE